VTGDYIIPDACSTFLGFHRSLNGCTRERHPERLVRILGSGLDAAKRSRRPGWTRPPAEVSGL